jgi:hypothetical protein
MDGISGGVKPRQIPSAPQCLGGKFLIKKKKVSVFYIDLLMQRHDVLTFENFLSFFFVFLPAELPL